MKLLRSLLLSLLLLINTGCATYVGLTLDKNNATEQSNNTQSQSKIKNSNSSKPQQQPNPPQKTKTTQQNIIEYFAGFALGYLLAGLFF